MWHFGLYIGISQICCVLDRVQRFNPKIISGFFRTYAQELLLCTKIKQLFIIPCSFSCGPFSFFGQITQFIHIFAMTPIVLHFESSTFQSMHFRGPNFLFLLINAGAFLSSGTSWPSQSASLYAGHSLSQLSIPWMVGGPGDCGI